MIEKTLDPLDPARPMVDEHSLEGRSAVYLRQALRRGAILAAARELFAEGGAANVTLRHLAATSGSTAPTIYGILGNRSLVLERALLEHHETCILHAERGGDGQLNTAVAFAETMWRISSVHPAYQRRLILFVRSEPEGRRISRLHAQLTVAAIVRWIGELCGRSRLAKRIGHVHLAEGIEAQIRTILLDWAEGSESTPALRRKLSRAVTIPLLRFMEERETNKVADWIDTLA